MHDSGDTDQATSFLGLGLAGDRQLALSQVPLAKALNRKLRGFLATSGAKVFNLTQRFDGGYVQVSSYNGIERAFIYAEPATPLEIDELPNAQILSGVIKDADLVVTLGPLEEEVLTLRGFKPTDQTWKAIFKKDPAKPTTSFNDEPRLAVKISDEIHYLGEHLDPDTTVPFPEKAAQYKEICSSMYSGLMAKAVQVILGYGKLQSPTASETHRVDGVQVKYDWRWARCHGIVRGAGNALWLVEISVTNGVLAMPLPMFKNTVVGTPGYQSLIKSKQDVLRETALLFGGLPSGGTFPTGGELTDALASGDVIRLATAAHMGPFFAKGHYSSWMGWSFNLGGTGVTPQAHNTCYMAEGENGTYVATGYHYKIVFNIIKTKNRQPNEPVATGSATLSLVGSGLLKLSAPDNDLTYNNVEPNSRYRFRIHNGDGVLAFTAAPSVYPREYVHNSFSPVNTTGLVSGVATADEEVVIIACHYGNTLDRIFIVHKDPISTYKNVPEATLTGNVLTAHNTGTATITDTTYDSNIYSTGVTTLYESGQATPTAPSNHSSDTVHLCQQYGFSGGYIKSDRCAPFSTGIVREESHEAHTDTTYSLISAVLVPSIGYDITYTETVVRDDLRIYSAIYTDEVCAWSAYARDGYMVHEPSNSKSSHLSGPIPGSLNMTTTYGSEPKIRCVTTTSPKSGVGDLRISYVPHDLSKRKGLGLGGYATFTRSSEDGIPGYENYISSIDGKLNEPFGDKFYAFLKFSTFGTKAHVLASVPFDKGVYKANYAAPDIDVPDPERKNNEIAKQGALIEDVEDITNPLTYSFIGYI